MQLSAFPVAVTALYGAANAILNVVLAMNVTRLRRTSKTSIGVGDSSELLLASRIHGNNAETVPLALVMLLIAELSGGASMWLHVLGGLLLIGRIAHAVGLPRKAPNPFRAGGILLTWGVILATSIYCLVLRTEGG